MASAAYHVTILPCDSQSVQQWGPRFIKYRLKALKTDPTCSTSSYEMESKISEVEWMCILTKPAFRVVVCVSTANEELQEVWESEWVGMLFLYGPLYDLKMADNWFETKWYVGGGFVSPSHRGQRILERLYNFILEGTKVLEMAQQAQGDFRGSRHRIRIQALAKPHETSTLRYYESGGLKQVKRMSLGDFSGSGWNFPISPDRVDMPVVLLEHVVEREAQIVSRL